MDNTQNIISFCSGYGGIELGIKRTGLPIRTVCYVEIETFAQANLVAKIEQGQMDAAPIWSNLKTFDGRPFRGKVHGIIGGYPCQPFSNAGQRKGTEDPRHLFPYICEHIRAIRPLWCFFENVGGHLNLGFDEVYKSLRDLGYKVEAGLFTAAEVGAPHKRERLFILAYSEQFGSRPGMPQNKSNIQRQELPAGKPHDRDKIRGDITSGCELEITSSQRTGGVSGQARGINRSSVLRQDNRKACAGGITATSELEVAPSLRQRQSSQEDQERRETAIGDRTSVCWPTGPGDPQCNWEEPRTVKSGMGRTVDGFASRVDELRLLGNGVVPQTAELAFRTLWNKTAGVIEEIKK